MVIRHPNDGCNPRAVGTGGFTLSLYLHLRTYPLLHTSTQHHCPQCCHAPHMLSPTISTIPGLCALLRPGALVSHSTHPTPRIPLHAPHSTHPTPLIPHPNAHIRWSHPRPPSTTQEPPPTPLPLATTPTYLTRLSLSPPPRLSLSLPSFSHYSPQKRSSM